LHARTGGSLAEVVAERPMLRRQANKEVGIIMVSSIKLEVDFKSSVN
jgi:hypothetical protein